MPVPDLLTIRKLESFAAVVAEGSISRAAEELLVSQPALSRQIADLERVCGVALLERTAAGVRPTAAGSAVDTHARVVLELLENTVEVARTARPTTTPVAVGLAPGLPAEWLVDLVERCRREVPDAELSLRDGSSGEHLRALRENRIDLGLLHQPPPEPLVGSVVRRDEIGVALAPGTVDVTATDVALADLDGSRVLVHARDQVQGHVDRIVAAAQDAGVRPSWRAETFTENALACAVSSRCDAVVLIEASARRMLPEWAWLPLTPAFRLETWVVRRARDRDIVDRVAGVLTEGMS